MSVKSYLSPEDVWDFFISNKARLEREMVMIAENTDTGYAIYITESAGFPRVSVCKNDKKPEIAEPLISREDCATSIKQLVMKFLMPVVVVTGNIPKLPESVPKEAPVSEVIAEEESRMEAIDDREDELALSLYDFLSTVVGDEEFTEFCNCEPSAIEEILDKFLMLLADEYGLTIYRPTYIETEMGEEIYAEYPYNEITE